MSTETPIIELKDVEVTFNSRTGSLFRPHKVHAVRGVNMRIGLWQVHDRERHVRPANANEGPSVLQR